MSGKCIRMFLFCFSTHTQITVRWGGSCRNHTHKHLKFCSWVTIRDEFEMRLARATLISKLHNFCEICKKNWEIFFFFHNFEWWFRLRDLSRARIVQEKNNPILRFVFIRRIFTQFVDKQMHIVSICRNSFSQRRLNAPTLCTDSSPVCSLESLLFVNGVSIGQTNFRSIRHVVRRTLQQNKFLKKTASSRFGWIFLQKLFSAK